MTDDAGRVRTTIDGAAAAIAADNVVTVERLNQAAAATRAETRSRGRLGISGNCHVPTRYAIEMVSQLVDYTTEAM